MFFKNNINHMSPITLRSRRLGVILAAFSLVAMPLISSASLSGTAPLTVFFGGPPSGGTGPLTYSWNFGDGSSAQGQVVSHTYAAAGTYTAMLTVTDSLSNMGSTPQIITVTGAGTPPPPSPSPTPPPRPPSTSVGPRVPVGPQASITCSAGSVSIAGNTNIQGVINSHAAGTSYCLSGTFSSQTVTPQTGDKITCTFGAILDGGGSTKKAFIGPSSNVTIQNCIVQNYNPGNQQGAIDFRNNGGPNTTLKNNEIRSNTGVGAEFQDGSSIAANYIHDNDEEGYACSGSNVVMTDNHIYHNNPKSNVSWGFEAGAGKAWATVNMVFNYNEVDNNYGPGPWWDTENQGYTVDYNNVHDNTAAGIMIEVSYDGTVAYNTVQNNALMTGNGNSSCQGSWLWCAGIMIPSSGGLSGSGKVLSVFNNTVTANGDSSHHGNGIAIIRQNRPDCPKCDSNNIKVYSNSVTLNSGAGNGAVVDNGENIYKNNITFSNDTYSVGCNNFWWNGSSGLSFGQWQGLGLDTAGTCH